MPQDDYTVIRRYLLQDVDAATAAALDERSRTDGEFFDRVKAAETDLIEEYVRGTLPPGDRQFVDQFLAPPHRQGQLAVTRALLAQLGPAASGPGGPAAAPIPLPRRRSRHASRPVRWVPLAAAASLILSIGSAGYLAVRTMQLEEYLKRASDSPSGGSGTTTPVVSTASFLLKADRSVRSGITDQTEIALWATVATVELNLPVGTSDAGTFAVQVERSAGVQVWGAPAVSLPANQGRILRITIPRAVLVPDDYVARVSAPSGGVVDEYRFRILGD
jgi:hypothetical protein